MKNTEKNERSEKRVMGEMEQWKQGSKCCDRFSFIDSAKCRTDWDEVTVRDVGQENW